MKMNDIILEMRHVTKKFPGVVALNDVSIDLRKGEILGIVGENGAGKSTLMKCLFGIYHKDGGEIWLKGQKVDFKSPHEALMNGISMVHQELEQVRDRNVMENVWLR